MTGSGCLNPTHPLLCDHKKVAGLRRGTFPLPNPPRRWEGAEPGSLFVVLPGIRTLLEMHAARIVVALVDFAEPVAMLRDKAVEELPERQAERNVHNRHQPPEA